MSLQTKELSKVFSSSTIQKHNSSQFNPLYGLILTCVHDYWKYQALTIQSFVNKVMSLLFSILSCFVKAFLSRSKHLLLSWVHSQLSRKESACNEGNRGLIPGLGRFPLSTTNWHLPRSLPMTEQQGHLPSAPREIELNAAIAIDLQQPLREFRVE